MYVKGDTIAAIATPPGQGGIAIVRVSGPDARALVASLFDHRGGGLDETRRVYVGTLRTSPTGSVIDQVLVFAMKAPHSYTGEDVVEIQCHGGSVVSAAVLDSVLAAGARAAVAGEFTRRAYINGRLDLAQAEAVADLIAARSEAGRRLAWSQLEGVLSERVGSLRAAILEARALCEAAIDFPEDEVPELIEGQMAARLGQVRGELETMGASFERARIRYEGARVALVGKPNVGKSSVLNALAGRECAIVTPIAGTTRDIVQATIAVSGVPIVLADTAGLRPTDDPLEAMGAERARGCIAVSAVTLLVLDGSGQLDRCDELVVEAVRGKRVVALLNKRDLPAQTTRDEARVLLPGATLVEGSALTGQGITETAAAVAAALDDEPDGCEGEVVIFRARHRDAARRASQHLERAETALASGAPPELIATDLTVAADELASITGEVTSEDVLDHVFAQFCIGK